MAPSKLVNRRDSHWDNFDMSYPHGSCELPADMSDVEIKQRIQKGLSKRDLLTASVDISFHKVPNGATNFIFFGVKTDPWDF